MAVTAKVLAVAAGTWLKLQRSRLWVVAAAEAAAAEVLDVVAEVTVTTVKVMTAGRVMAAAAKVMVATANAVARRSRSWMLRPWLWPQRPRRCLRNRGRGSSRGPGQPGVVAARYR